jgi:GDP-L-fucose synthase
MLRDSRVLVTGGAGMVGRALTKQLALQQCATLLAPTRFELDLGNRDDVNRFWRDVRPDHVFLIAARVGGIGANIADPVGFLAENTRMTLNALEACHRAGVRKVLFLGSSCIYPRDCPQPMKESYLMTGPLEPTNEGYALSKIVGLQLAQAYRAQYGLNTICPMPCNIYGTGDHFDLQKSHVLSALVRRFVESHESREPAVTLWGTGSARREFIHVDDVVAAMLFLFERYDGAGIVNVGTGTDVSIRELAGLVAEEVGYTGEIRWDPSRPDGMPRKCLDTSMLEQMGFSPGIGLREGIRRTVREYRSLAGLAVQ